MTSLDFIMDMDEDEPKPYNNKKDGASVTRDQPFSASDQANPGELRDHSHHTASTKRRGATGRNPKSSAAATSSSSSTSSSAARPQPPTRNSSSTSSEEMDRGYGNHGHGHGHGHASSSGPGSIHSRAPPGSDLPVKLTPITGRVSRARKGIPVHTCDICRPSKTFTRAEHLRRHQLSHQTPGYPCTYPGCDRAFHRADLLARHATRHEQDGDKASSRGTGNSSRRTSTTSMDDGIRYHPTTPSVGGGSSRNSISTPSSDLQPGTTYGNNANNHQSLRASGTGSAPMSPPQAPGRRVSYRSTSTGPTQPSGGYVLSTGIPAMNQPPNVAGSPGGMNYNLSFEPRSAHQLPLYVITQDLPESNPGLLPTHDVSPWASSESNFSTHSDVGRSRNYVRSNFESPAPEWPVGAFVSPYPAASQDIRSPGESLHAITPAGAYFTNPNPFSPSPHGHNPYPAQLLDPVAMFPDDSAYLDHVPQHYSSVRSPTPPNISSSVQSAESLVTFATPLPDAHAMVGRYKDQAAFLGSLTNATFLTAIQLQRPVRNAIPDLLQVYWKRFDPVFPLIHRRSFETAPNEILKCAMAAIASQFLEGKEDRAKGNQLHEFAWQEVKRVPQWNVQTMQTILLCEFFARFRGKRASIRSSTQFQSLYSRVDTTRDSIHDTLDSSSSTPMGMPPPMTDGRWYEWIEAETRRRLLAASFVLDVHSSVYYELPLMQPLINPCPPIPLIAVTQDIWNAPTAEDWMLQMSVTHALSELLELREENITPARIASAPALDQAVFLASEALRLPKRPGSTPIDLSRAPDLSAVERILGLFPGAPTAYAYAALHYTPLHDLLAVSGDSWLFTQKVLPSQSFQQHQKRLKHWSGSLHAATAARFAAKALLAHLAADDRLNETTPTTSAMPAPGDHWVTSDLSEYWGIYACALICWAMGFHATKGTTNSNNTSSQGQHQRSISHDRTASAAVTAQEIQTRSEALAWLSMVAEAEPVSEVLVRAHGRTRREVIAVVSLVRKRLEEEAAGGKNKLLVDAIGVMRKLEDGAFWKWF
ncbi:hypothetical protein BX600DRAFT_230297 [Xylariales sp. PMI_506]|nr:hypothetical protein BX600DRAFT_230297 [Xylariales sp. PMI_506]